MRGRQAENETPPNQTEKNHRDAYSRAGRGAFNRGGGLPRPENSASTGSIVLAGEDNVSSWLTADLMTAPD
jgi:hypothetical protein